MCVVASPGLSVDQDSDHARDHHREPEPARPTLFKLCAERGWKRSASSISRASRGSACASWPPAMSSSSTFLEVKCARAFRSRDADAWACGSRWRAQVIEKNCRCGWENRSRGSPDGTRTPVAVRRACSKTWSFWFPTARGRRFPRKAARSVPHTSGRRGDRIQRALGEECNSPTSPGNRPHVPRVSGEQRSCARLTVRSVFVGEPGQPDDDPRSSLLSSGSAARINLSITAIPVCRVRRDCAFYEASHEHGGKSSPARAAQAVSRRAMSSSPTSI